jgi:predicted transcriptional regulator
MRAMTLRLDDETAAALATVAFVQGASKADIVREALQQHLRRRIDDDATRVRWNAVERATFDTSPASGS